MFSFGKKSSTDNDWVSEATAKIEGAIDAVRDKAVVPLTTAARWIVYGMLMLIVGIAAIVILAIALVRGLDILLDYIPWDPAEGIWLAHLLTGAIFVGLGLFAWSRRTAKADNEG